MKTFSGVQSVVMAATTAVIDLGTFYEKCMIWVPTLATDNYLTISLSFDGTTYLTLYENDGAASEIAVEVPSAGCRGINLNGARYITFTAPATSQTVTVVVTAVR